MKILYLSGIPNRIWILSMDFRSRTYCYTR